MNKTSPLTSLELFSGGGGLALGTEAAGFEHLALVEFNKHAVATVKRNRPAWPTHELDVRKFDYMSYVERVDLIAAGAPCQPFSLGGRHLGDQDERNMFPEVFRAVRAVRPKAVLLENVKGLARESFRPYLDYIVLQLQLPWLEARKGESWERHKQRLVKAVSRLEDADPEQSYDASVHPVNCADFGVPQRRMRVMMVAVRRDLRVKWTWPTPTHSEDALLFAKWVDGSYWREHRVRRQALPETLRRRVESLRAQDRPTTEPWRTLREALKGLPSPKDGVPARGIPNHVGIPGARLYEGHDGSELDSPSKTIKAGVHGVPGGESIVILDDGSHRYLTVRESARVQTFPDAYEFVGCRGEAMRQIGNAVPVLVAQMMAERIRDLIVDSTLRPTRSQKRQRTAAEPARKRAEEPQISLDFPATTQ